MASSDDLVSVDSVLPPYLRELLPFESFTRMQSKCLDTWRSDQNLLICAPTGSGKTVCFELAIMRLVHSVLKCRQKKEFPSNGLGTKVLYLSPTKSLCHEKAAEWKRKFAPLKLKIEMVIGELSTSLNESRLRGADIFLATSEKWDSVTRSLGSRGLCGVISDISLLLLDEVHHVGGGRGAAFEIVVTRMLVASDENWGSDVTFRPGLRMMDLRVVAASATVQNIDDVRIWLRVAKEGTFVFDNTYRPVPLRFVVRGYHARNPWLYNKVFEKQLLPILLAHGDGKPALVFCTSRRQTLLSAQALSKQLSSRSPQKAANELTTYLSIEQRRRLHEAAESSTDPVLRALLPTGIALHNADMSDKSRKLVEELFRERLIRCLFTTSTLAQGVNLPARLVVICGTTLYADGRLREYDCNLMLQMCGRAGRPGLDDQGIAVIMTSKSLETIYQNMPSKTEPLESQLQGNVLECFNAEIARQEIIDIPSAVLFMRSTFYWATLQSRSVHQRNATLLLEAAVTNIVTSSMKSLSNAGLITFDGDFFGVSSTSLGTCVAKYCLSFETTRALLEKLHAAFSPAQVMRIIVESPEMLDGLFVRRSEKKRLNEMNAGIRVPVVGRVKNASDKALVLLQIGLGNGVAEGVEMDCALRNEAEHLLRTASRLARCTLDVVLEQMVQIPYESMMATLQVCRAIVNRCQWDGCTVLQQMLGLGGVEARVLCKRGVTTIAKFSELDQEDIITITQCQDQVAYRLREKLKTLPRFGIDVVENRVGGGFGLLSSLEIGISVSSFGEVDQVQARNRSRAFVTVGSPSWGLISSHRFSLNEGHYTLRCDFPSTGSPRLGKYIDVVVGCEDIVGVDVSRRFVDLIPKAPTFERTLLSAAKDAGSASGRSTRGVFRSRTVCRERLLVASGRVSTHLRATNRQRTLLALGRLGRLSSGAGNETENTQVPNSEGVGGSEEVEETPNGSFFSNVGGCGSQTTTVSSPRNPETTNSALATQKRNTSASEEGQDVEVSRQSHIPRHLTEQENARAENKVEVDDEIQPIVEQSSNALGLDERSTETMDGAMAAPAPLRCETYTADTTPRPDSEAREYDNVFRSLFM